MSMRRVAASHAPWVSARVPSTAHLRGHDLPRPYQTYLSDVTTVVASHRTMARVWSCTKHAYLRSAASRINTQTHTCAWIHAGFFFFFPGKYGNPSLCCYVNKHSQCFSRCTYTAKYLTRRRREQQTEWTALINHSQLPTTGGELVDITCLIITRPTTWHNFLIVLFNLTLFLFLW